MEIHLILVSNEPLLRNSIYLEPFRTLLGMKLSDEKQRAANKKAKYKKLNVNRCSSGLITGMNMKPCEFAIKLHNRGFNYQPLK